jgi:hypothetical protein
MGIICVADDLPPELASELDRETAGETLKWAGRSVGGPERSEGFAVIAAGALIVALNAPGVAAALGTLLNLAERGQLPAGGYGSVGASLIAFFAGIALILLGLRFLAVARRTIWAITDARLLRMIAGRDACCDWRKDDILEIRRLNWDDASRRALAVTAREGRGDFRLIMTGRADLESADRALVEMTA